MITVLTSWQAESIKVSYPVLKEKSALKNFNPTLFILAGFWSNISHFMVLESDKGSIHLFPLLSYSQASPI